MKSERSLLDAVQEVARLTGDAALKHFRTGVDVITKSDGSPVTIADREAETVAREWITRYFPRDGILGEEHGAANADASRRWIIDPIDGTKSFVRGVPLWGTLIAVAEGDDVVAGAINCSAAGEMVCAAKGEGCWLNGVRSYVSATADLAAALALTTDENFQRSPEKQAAWRKLSAKVAMTRGWGDCYGYMLIATGRADIMADGAMSAWDSAALLPVIEEAGGVFTDWTGQRTGFGGNAIATNAALAVEARTVLGAPLAARR